MTNADKGAKALEASDGLQAASYYTKALIDNPSSPDYFTQRSIAFTRLRPARYDLALKDAEYAVLLGQKRAKREKIQAGQRRRMVALYGLGRYEEAKAVLESMLKWRPKDVKPEKMEHEMWMAKISSKLKATTVEGETSPTVEVQEYPDIKIPSDAVLKRWLQAQLGSDGLYNFTDEQDRATGDTTTTEVQSTSEPASKQFSTVDTQSTAQPSPPKPPAAATVRYDWYQDKNNITLTFYAKNVGKDTIEAQVTDSSIKIGFPNPGDKDIKFEFSINQTYSQLNSSKHSMKVLGTKIELVLPKAEPGVKWAGLSNDAPKIESLPNPYSASKSAKSTQKTVELTKTTDAQDKGITTTGKPSNIPIDKGSDHGTPAEEEEEEEEPDDEADSDNGGDPVDGFFKKLYKGADPDTRRAMMKSFQESNGTVLSTNWGDVGKGKVEPVKGKDDS